MKQPTLNIRIASVAVASALMLVAGGLQPAAAENHNPCDGFSKENTVTRLNTADAFSRGGAQEWQDLARQFERYRADIEALMQARGLSELTQPLFDAVRAGNVSERSIENGETFEWMAFRKKGQADSTGPVCFSTRKTYSAFEVKVVLKKQGPAPAVSCDFEATGDCREHTLSVNLPSAGATVTMNGTTVVESGETSWQGDFADRFDTTYRFEATNSAPGTTTVETYTFVIPKVCLNLAFDGVTTTEETGAAATCSESATVDPCPRPQVELTAPEEALAREPFPVSATGNGALALQVTCPEGETLEYDSPSSPVSGDPTCRRAGEAGVSATVTTEFGDTATATDTVNVLRNSAWTIRAFGGPLSGDDFFMTNRIRSNGVNERTKLKVEDGFLAGVGAEYHFNDRVGLEGALLLGNLDSTFILDLNDDWASDDDDLGLFGVTLGPNFHLTPNSRVDFYIGPFIGFINPGEGDYRTLGESTEVEFDSEFIFGAQLGLGVPFGESPWGLAFGARYLDLSIEEDGGAGREFDLDPLALTAGISYTF